MADLIVNNRGLLCFLLIIGVLFVASAVAAHETSRAQHNSRSALQQLLDSPYHHSLEPEVPTNGAVKTSFLITMTLVWVLFGVLAVGKISLLWLWMILGVFTVVIGFIQLGPMNKFHQG